MKKPFFSIRNKLLLSILLILFVSYSTLLFSTVKVIDRFLASEVSKDLEASLKFAQDQFFFRADQMRSVLMQPAMAPPAQQQIIRKNREWLTDALRRWQATLPILDVITIVDPQMKVLARLHGTAGGDILRLPDIVQRALKDRRVVTATELVSADFLCQEAPSSYCRPPGQRREEMMMLTVVMPVITPSGELIGAIVAGDIINNDPYYPDQLQKIFGRNVELTIMQQGRKIASSLKKDAYFAGMLAPDILAVLEEGKSFRGEANIGDMSYSTAFEPITDSRGKAVGSLAVALSREDFDRIRRHYEYNIMVSASIGILLSFVIAFVATRQITRPLQELSRSVRRIEEGDLNQRVRVTSEDELGALGDCFNRMVGALVERDATITKRNVALQDLNELLEGKVAERTAELRIEMERMETVLTSMVEGIVVTDHTNRVILVNPAAERLFNIASHRVIGQPVNMLCELGGFPGLADRIDIVRTGGAAAAVVEQDLAVEGKKLKVNLSPLLDDAGSFAGVIMSVRDLTLEEMVDKMKTEFISTVSHELKTPLTSMKGSVQYILAKGKWLTGTERELLTVCLRNTERLIRLISDMLDFSKMDEGRLDLDFKPQSLRALAAYAIDEINPLAMERTITIINEIVDSLPLIYGDHDRLVQVITNLLSNAVKFSPMAKVVTVSAVEEGSFVAVTVADRGTPLDPADHEKLFRKFQRLDNSRGGELGGTGLGLVICKEIVEKHHGKIFYQPGVTGGNAFTFTLPVYKDYHES